jgi:hypothetical protein
MNNINFAFWLQGFFELRSQPEPLTQNQVELIYSHLQLAKKVDGKLDSFGAWLEALLDLVKTGSAKLDEKTMELITTKLGELFQHEIDPLYKDGEALNKIHKLIQRPPRPDNQGGWSGGKGTTYRC